eukprot:scaffold40810_cov35-Prasinocladus_malaysianus.AAC.1
MPLERCRCCCCCCSNSCCPGKGQYPHSYQFGASVASFAAPAAGLPSAAEAGEAKKEDFGQG